MLYPENLISEHMQVSLDQWSETEERDEHIYHERLVHIPLLLCPKPRRATRRNFVEDVFLEKAYFPLSGQQIQNAKMKC